MLRHGVYCELGVAWYAHRVVHDMPSVSPKRNYKLPAHRPMCYVHLSRWTTAYTQVPSSGDLSGSFLLGGGSFPVQRALLPADQASTTISVSATFTTSGLDMDFTWCDISQAWIRPHCSCVVHAPAYCQATDYAILVVLKATSCCL